MPLLVDLARLDSARPLSGPALVAEIDGHPWAALSLADGRAIADPFRRSAGAVKLLRLRASQLGAQRPAPRLRRLAWLAHRARA